MARNPAVPTQRKAFLRKGTWLPEEDRRLVAYISSYGIWNWNEMPKYAGLSRSGKSCRLRWMNYLKPGIKRGNFTKEEEETIIKLYKVLGNRWAAIAAKLPQRTDNEIKNLWKTRLRKVAKVQEASISTKLAPEASASTNLVTKAKIGSRDASKYSMENNSNFETPSPFPMQPVIEDDDLLVSSSPHESNSTIAIGETYPSFDEFLSLWESDQIILPIEASSSTVESPTLSDNTSISSATSHQLGLHEPIILYASDIYYDLWSCF